METDHYHYLHPGGENYHVSFNTWNMHRGQEYDHHISKVEKPEAPEHIGRWSHQYESNKTSFKSDADYSTPKTFQGAIDWPRYDAVSENEGETDKAVQELRKRYAACLSMPVKRGTN